VEESGNVEQLLVEANVVAFGERDCEEMATEAVIREEGWSNRTHQVFSLLCELRVGAHRKNVCHGGSVPEKRWYGQAGRGILWRMFAALLIRWAILGVAFAITSWLLTGMDVTGGFWAYLWVSAIFGLVNAFIGTIVRLFTFPLIILTLGLFSIFINACLLGITDWLTDHLTIDEFWWTAIWAAIILSIVSMVLDLMVSSATKPRPATSY
jgi:putative membrane protein